MRTELTLNIWRLEFIVFVSILDRCHCEGDHHATTSYSNHIEFDVRYRKVKED